MFIQVSAVFVPVNEITIVSNISYSITIVLIVSYVVIAFCVLQRCYCTFYY